MDGVLRSVIVSERLKMRKSLAINYWQDTISGVEVNTNVRTINNFWGVSKIVLPQAWEAAAPSRFLLTCIFHELKKNGGKVKNSTKFKTSWNSSKVIDSSNISIDLDTRQLYWKCTLVWVFSFKFAENTSGPLVFLITVWANFNKETFYTLKMYGKRFIIKFIWIIKKKEIPFFG